MKRLSINTGWAALMAALFALSSCYKDLSTVAGEEIPDIIINSSDDEGVLNVSFGQDFVLEPEVFQEGSSKDDFTYLWEIDLRPGKANDRIKLGTDLKLEYKIGNSPSDRPYILSLKVTDNKTGITAIKSWKVYVSSSLGEGILVAHTRDDGKTSDLDLVSDPNITWDFKGTRARYVRNLYSFANGVPYAGRIEALCSGAYSFSASFNQRGILIGGKDSFIELDPLDYKISRKNSELFYAATETEFNVSHIFNFAGYISGAVVNDRLYGMVCNSANAYNKIPYPRIPDNLVSEKNIAYSYEDQGSVCVYDKEHGEIMATRGWMLASGGLAVSPIKPLTFDIASSDVLAGGTFKDFLLGFVVKKNTGGYCLFAMDLQGFEPKGTEYALDAPDIDKAISFDFCSNCNIFYYTTEDAIYANTILGNKVITKKVNWTLPDPDEKITGIRHYQQAWYGTHQYGMDYEFALPLNRLMMLVITHNEKTGEGKIYPRVFNVNTGLFTFKTMEPYTGFGKIETITTTFK